jgi:two-component system sensor histidine kinase VicK
VFVNLAFRLLFDSTEDISSPKALFELVHRDDRERVKRAYLRLKPYVLTGDVVFRMTGKSRRWFRLSMLSGRYAGEVTIAGYLDDITALQEHHKALDELSSKNSQVLNIISHDLAGPFTSMQALTMILERKMEHSGDPDIKRLIATMARICRKGTTLLKEFIKDEFVESAGKDLAKRTVNLVEILRNLSAEYAQTWEETGKAFQFQCVQPAVYAAVDERKFLQAITNLVSNALKFTPKGGTVTLRIVEEGNDIVISVSDTGIGIPKRYHGNLFEKFNGARRPGLNGEPSIGLGMSIVKTIVNWHNGTIWFQSEEGRGTTFFIRIAKGPAGA